MTMEIVTLRTKSTSLPDFKHHRTHVYDLGSEDRRGLIQLIAFVFHLFSATGKNNTSGVKIEISITKWSPCGRALAMQRTMKFWVGAYLSSTIPAKKQSVLLHFGQPAASQHIPDVPGQLQSYQCPALLNLVLFDAIQFFKIPSFQVLTGTGPASLIILSSNISAFRS